MPCLCGKSVLAKGYCSTCYRRWRYQTDPEYRLKCIEARKEWGKKNVAHLKKWNKAYSKRIKSKHRAYNLKRLYGISVEQYDEMCYRQGGRCAICQDSLEGIESKSPCIDHNHETGKIRGVLCHKCNRGLGYLRDSTRILKSAIIYVERNQ